MKESDLIDWLLSGDIAIQYQVHRDLLNVEQKQLRDQIAEEGWGAYFLSFHKQDGYWGRGFYQPKWTSTNYTLLDLKNLAISPNNNEIRQTVSSIGQTHKSANGEIYPIRKTRNSDICINGMFLIYASYFRITEQMRDGGFNCYSNRKQAVHSSLHSTISVLEGILEYSKNGYKYRLEKLQKIEAESSDFYCGINYFNQTGLDK